VREGGVVDEVLPTYGLPPGEGEGATSILTRGERKADAEEVKAEAEDDAWYTGAGG
jgi:hypothetical protein